MFIRKAENKDAEQFLSMLKQLDKETKFMLYEPEERTTSIEETKARLENSEKSGSVIFVAEVNGEIAGFISASRGFARRVNHSAYIVMGILAGYSGRGIGKALFEGLEKWAINSGITRLELTVMMHNEKAINLYKKMGFEIEGLKKHSLIVDNQYVDEYYMGKLL